MKLKKVKHTTKYNFVLTFENKEEMEVDLKDLISSYVDLKDLDTAKVNKDWGCLEFKDGSVDIDPKTLYNFCHQSSIVSRNSQRRLKVC